jgi:hypothetical protein
LKFANQIGTLSQAWPFPPFRTDTT